MSRLFRKQLKEISDSADAGPVYRQAKVLSINVSSAPWKVSVDMGGSLTINNVVCMSHVYPIVGENVWILSLGKGRWIVTGSSDSKRRYTYKSLGWLSASLGSPVTLTSSLQPIVSFANVCRNGDYVRFDAQARIAGGSAGYARLAVTAIDPSSVATNVYLGDSQPTQNGVASDVVVPLSTDAFAIYADGSWTFELQIATVFSSGTWVVNNNTTILRAEFLTQTQ